MNKVIPLFRLEEKMTTKGATEVSSVTTDEKLLEAIKALAGGRELLEGLVGKIESLSQKNTTLRQDLLNAEREIAARDARLENAEKDPLTGLLNRDGLVSRVKKLLDLGEPLAVLFFDLDKFKLINEFFSHEKGDMALHQMSYIARQVFREGDVISRYGGEEFVVVCPAQDADVAIKVAERFRDALSKAPLRVTSAEYGKALALCDSDEGRAIAGGVWAQDFKSRLCAMAPSGERNSQDPSESASQSFGLHISASVGVEFLSLDQVRSLRDQNDSGQLTPRHLKVLIGGASTAEEHVKKLCRNAVGFYQAGAISVWRGGHEVPQSPVRSREKRDMSSPKTVLELHTRTAGL